MGMNLKDGLKEARERVKKIEQTAKGGDLESAYDMEDKLFVDFIKLVAKSGKESPLKEIARAVLKSKQIDWARLHA
jgi:hypothetical protein